MLRAPPGDLQPAGFEHVHGEGAESERRGDGALRVEEGGGQEGGGQEGGGQEGGGQEGVPRWKEWWIPRH